MLKKTVVKMSFYLMASLLLCTSVNAEKSNDIGMLPVSIRNETIVNTKNNNGIKIMEDADTYTNLGVSIARNYVNVRREPSLESEVIGKLYEGSAAVILEENGEWTKVSSGSVKGYIFKEYLAVGDEIKPLLNQYASKIANVNTTTLRVREEASLDARTIALIPYGSMYQVLEEDENWIKIQLDGFEGYVSKEYISLNYEFGNAVSIQEEKAMPVTLQQTVTAKVNSSITTNMSSVVKYAKKFIGNPYVWGGTSLTDGADCSGFVQSVFKNFGITLPRTSRQQAQIGSKVEEKNLKVGDLVFYAEEDTVNHVAIYIGNNKIIHASNPKDGIKISKYNYRAPYTIRRVTNET